MSTFLQLHKDFDGFGFQFKGHVEFADWFRLNLTPFERGIIDDIFLNDTSASQRLHGLALLWQRMEEQKQAQDRYAASGVPIVPVEGS